MPYFRLFGFKEVGSSFFLSENKNLCVSFFGVWLVVGK